MIAKIKNLVKKPIQLYRLYKLKKQLDDYPNQLKRISDNQSEEEFDNQVLEAFNNED